MTLWHFTCEHSYMQIGRRGLLEPRLHPLLRTLGPMVWLTDDPAPARDDVGLTSTFISCDRMAYRYRVTAPDAVRWTDIRDHFDSAVVADLESLGRPSSWWLSFAEVPAVLS